MSQFTLIHKKKKKIQLNRLPSWIKSCSITQDWGHKQGDLLTTLKNIEIIAEFEYQILKYDVFES